MIRAQSNAGAGTPTRRAFPSRPTRVAPLLYKPAFQGHAIRPTLAFRAAQSSAAGAALRPKRRWPRNLWRAVWVPYAILTCIPITSTVLGAYYYMRGDKKRARGCAFFAATGFLSLPLSVPMFVAAPYILIADRDKRTVADKIQKIWGRTTTQLFFETKVEGLERIKHLDGKAAIYVSNHQSWLDIYALFWVDPLPLKIVSKKEIMMIPLCGWLMHLIGHIPFDRKGGANCFDYAVRCLTAMHQFFSFLKEHVAAMARWGSSRLEHLCLLQGIRYLSCL